MSVWTVVWLVVFAVAGAVEGITLTIKGHKGTLSQTLQRAFLNHGTAIKAVTRAAWAGFAVWFMFHIWGG